MFEKIQDILAITYTLCFFALLIICIYTPVKEGDNLILGLFGGETLILSFYFGASKKQD